MQVRFWLRLYLICIGVFFFIASLLYFEYKGVGISKEEQVELLELNCLTMVSDGVCEAKVRREDGEIVDGFSQCSDSYLGRTVTLDTGTGLFSGKPRYYIRCNHVAVVR